MGMELAWAARACGQAPLLGPQNGPCSPYSASSASNSCTCSRSSSQANRTHVNYDAMDEIQIAEINSQVRRYLAGTLDEIDVRIPSSGPPCPADLGLPVPGVPSCAVPACLGTPH